METTRIFTLDDPGLGRLSGLVTVPPDFETTTDLLPVVVFLHGMGERGDGSPKDLNRLKKHGVPKLFCADPAWRGLRAVTVSPQCPETTVWPEIPELIKRYADAAVKEFRGDPERVSLTGLSMGGFGTWALLSLYPKAFLRAAPICGGIEDEKQKFPRSLKGVPVRVFHAVDDPVVPIELDIAAVRQAIVAGADISFTTYCGLGHDCWTHTYEETDLIDWLVKG